MVRKSSIVRIEQSTNWFQLGILGYGRLRTSSGWYRDCGGYARHPRQNGFSSVHRFDFF